MEKFLIFTIVVLTVLAVVQLVRVYELSYKIRDEHSEEKVTDGENDITAYMFLVFMFAFFGFLIWMMVKYGDGGLGPAASAHGDQMDGLLKFNWWIILPVFFITNTLLFVFAFMYRRNPNRKAMFFPHSNKLEMIWTVAPAMTLAAVMIYGLKTWNFIMNEQEEGTVIEVYAKQFDWTARYSGENNTLGASDYKLLDPASNPLAVITTKSISEKYADLDKKIAKLDENLKDNTIEKFVNNKKTYEYLLPDAKIAEMQDKLESLKRQKYRIQEGIEKTRNAEQEDADASDDIVVKELHLIKGQPYTFYFRSQDVLHSAFFPHFRAQMNCVPGMQTKFSFTPTKTTKEMREDPYIQQHYAWINKEHNKRKREIGEEEEVVEFDYVLLCNKICGAGHSNMQMKIIVETEAEFKEWIEQQKTIEGKTVKYWNEVVSSDENSEVTENTNEEEVKVDENVEADTSNIATVDVDLTAGEAIYTSKCIACHQADGNGLPGAFPPLASSDYLLSGDNARIILQAINGSSGEIVVNGVSYNGVMPPQGLTNKEARDVVNYILNSWGNAGGTVTLDDVEAAQANM